MAFDAGSLSRTLLVLLRSFSGPSRHPCLQGLRNVPLTKATPPPPTARPLAAMAAKATPPFLIRTHGVGVPERSKCRMVVSACGPVATAMYAGRGGVDVQLRPFVEPCSLA